MGSFNDLINQIRNWPNTKPVPMTYDERSSTGIWAILGLLTNDFQNGTISGAFSKTQQQLSVAIVTGIVTGKDGIALDPFAGCVIDAIFVTTGSGNWIDVTQAAGYLGVGVNDNDNMMLSPNFIAEHNDSRDAGVPNGRGPRRDGNHPRPSSLASTCSRRRELVVAHTPGVPAGQY